MNLDKIMSISLSNIDLEGGNVMHALKKSDFGFAGFEEAYFSWIKKDFIKAWKRHNKMTMNLVVPLGNVRFIFASDDNSQFKTIIIGSQNYSRINVPPGIWFGFQGIDEPKSLILNLANIEHDPNEMDRLDINEIKYDWSKK